MTVNKMIEKTEIIRIVKDFRRDNKSVAVQKFRVELINLLCKL